MTLLRVEPFVNELLELDVRVTKNMNTKRNCTLFEKVSCHILDNGRKWYKIVNLLNKRERTHSFFGSKLVHQSLGYGNFGWERKNASKIIAFET